MPTLTDLPLDLEQSFSSNLRTNEIHYTTFANNKTNRVIVPDFGAFYKNTVVVRDKNGKALTFKTDYQITYHYELFTELTGKPVSALIVVTNRLTEAPFTIDYHAVGGNFSLSLRELKDVIDFIINSPEKIKWDDIIDKPTAYLPEDHMHKLWQAIGLHTLVTETNRLGEALKLGAQPILDDCTDYWQFQIQGLRDKLAEYEAKVWAHINDDTNPHLTDKVKLLLGNINNWPLADKIQSVDLSNRTMYQPIGGIYHQLQADALPRLINHINSKAAPGIPDPHEVTLAQLGAYSSTEIDAIFNTKLAKIQAAIDTERLSGVLWDDMYNDIRSKLDITVDLDQTTRLKQKLFGDEIPNWNPDEYALTGANKFVKYADLLKRYNDTLGSIFYAGNLTTGGASSAGAWAAIERFRWVSPGTFVIGAYLQGYAAGYSDLRLLVARRVTTGNGWEQLI